MLDLIAIRNHDFIKECRRQMRSLPPTRPIRVREIAVGASRARPPRYYLSYEYALKRLRRYRRRHLSTPWDTKERQWADLSERVARIERRRGCSDREALQQELTDGAPPEYYMSPSYAVRLFHALGR